MYAQGSRECLKNAEHLFGDATMLLQNKSFGAAQSLIVTAMEEAGKAIILELANFNYIDKEVVEHSMRKHPPKKVVFLAVENGLLFVEQIDGRQDSCIIDKNIIQKLENKLKAGLEDLENKRQNGFYVQVDINNGVVVKSPNNIERFEIEEIARKAESFLKFSKLLCEFFRYYRESPPLTTRNNLRVLQENLENFTFAYDEV